MMLTLPHLQMYFLLQMMLVHYSFQKHLLKGQHLMPLELSRQDDSDTVVLEVTETTQDNVEAPRDIARKSRPDDRATTTSWVPTNENDATKNYSYLGPEHVFDDDLPQPIDYVGHFFTVRQARMSCIKKGKADEKQLMKKGRSAYEAMKSTYEGVEITYVKWYDNKIVHLVSTFAKALPTANVSSWLLYRRDARHLQLPG
ncbi:hypothetical protein Pcinc_021540 [Petrolisthes cinctipes]|uniref:PiggyBac transposable element-derived protein domain-containing protein n=1 Tax=Petrolisthes cinctipes TaxID=88211 RepID=A0AAE1FG93_PETCI|nr:hypothetical protein Pcinc_021540 [Petrolisthes cinctipes]